MTRESDYTVRSALASFCKWNASSEIIVDESTRYTGERLYREAKIFAQALQAQGIVPGDRIAFMGPSSCRFFAAYFGAHLLGCVTCNIHMRESAGFIGLTLANIAANVVVCSESLASIVSAGVEESGRSITIMTLGDELIEAADEAYGSLLKKFPDELPDVCVSPDDTAIIILSSGSTGAPKGILHSNRNFVSWLRAGPSLFGHVSRATRFLVIVGTSFAAWPFSTIPVLYAGGTLVLVDGFTPQGFCEKVQQEKITMAGPVPTMIRMLTPDITAQYDLSSFRMMLCAGEPPTTQDIERILSWADTDIRCLYLASESAPGASTFWELADLQMRNQAVCAGKPIAGADLRVVDPDGGIDDEMPNGETGELVLKGSTISQGYLNNPELSASRFIEGWWRSGDLGRVDDNGYVHVEGRTDNTINSGGIKVQGEEVEVCLIAHPVVDQVAVIGVSDEKWGQRIEAHVAVNRAIDEQALREHCSAHLAPFKCPKNYIFHEQLPVGVTGKLDRVSLRKTYAVDQTQGEG